LITCNRCGKENQDHYKFCLGCGNELSRPAPAHAPSAGNGNDGPIETARTVLPPAPLGGMPAAMAATVSSGELRSSGGPAKPKGGIPWNDSPKMPAPVPFQLPPNPLAGPAPAARSTGGGGIHPSTTPAPVRPTGGPAPGSEMVCPNCGKSVQVGFAFCGACGTRVGSAQSGPQPRTMFMAGSSAPAAAVAPRGRLILIRPDGSEGGSHPIHDGDNLIGRGQAPLFDADAYLSPRHAELSVGPNGVMIRDLQSLNGVFLKIVAEEPLESGDIFRIGQELLRFEVISPPQALEDGTEVMGTPNPGFWGRLSVIVGRDVDGSAFPLFGEAIVLGRERGDILFPEDGYVSGTHARISLHDERAFLTDLGSSNGTFLRLHSERVIPTGSYMLMGQQLFRLEFR
jgi:pSer/pThr/pTyr-binding forkhead associated (FHA) protein